MHLCGKYIFKASRLGDETSIRTADMKLQVALLTLLGFAVGSMARGLCGCGPDLLGPVCGSDGFTYPSQCQLSCDGGPGVYMVSRGPCNNYGPYPPYNPYGPYPPYNPYGPYPPYNPYGPYPPYNPYGPYPPYNPYGPYNPYNQYGPYNPYGPVDPFDPYGPLFRKGGAKHEKRVQNDSFSPSK